MESVAENDFLEWLAPRGITLDGRYRPPQCLVYSAGEKFSRFWCLPDSPKKWPFFVGHMLEGLGDWVTCAVWPRGGSWPKFSTLRDANAPEKMRAAIFRGMGIDPGLSGAVRFRREDVGELIAILSVQAIVSWHVTDDVFVIPDAGQGFLHLESHDVIHATFAQEQGINDFVQHMTYRGYALPTELPDPTFKRPEWMSS